jgi:hypothetical protein
MHTATRHCVPTVWNDLRIKIVALSRLSLPRLEDASLELQVDLELWSADRLKLVPEYRWQPYDNFQEFLLAISGEGPGPEESSLLGLTPTQLYCAAAWCYLDIVDAVMAYPEDAEIATMCRAAAERLIADASACPPRVPCGLMLNDANTSATHA